MFLSVFPRKQWSPIIAAAALVSFLVFVSWASVQATSHTGRILVDNHLNIADINIGSDNDDEQGFTTGSEPYLLTGVEITVLQVGDGESFSLAIVENTTPQAFQTPLYELDAPAVQDGKVFFDAPPHAYLKPDTNYLLRISMTAGSARIGTTSSTDESDLGLPGWSISNNYWTSFGPLKGISWTSESGFVFAMTVRGTEIPDKQGEKSYSSGHLAFSRHTGTSPTVRGFINDATDTDWFNTSLSFDYGGRYRMDIEPGSLTNVNDIGVRAFYVDYPHDHSRDPVVELTAVSDPPEGYVSWHFIAGRNYGPFFEVYADNGTTGDYKTRVVYDPERVWTGTEVVRGDLPHDDTTWATIEVDGEEADQGVYHYYEDHDWFAVDLEEDTSYLFQAIAAGAYSHYMDPAITLYDETGSKLASDIISHEDSTTTSVSIAHQVGTGEDGTYYLDVSNASLWDDPDKMSNVGITEPIVLFSPFLGTRFYLVAATVNNNMRSLRSISVNAEPRILNRRAITIPEGIRLGEHIAAFDSDVDDLITEYEISGGDDQESFRISDGGVLSLKSVPDYEVPADANMDNVYEVQVQVTSGTGNREQSTSADFTITITNDESESETVLVSNTGQTAKGNATVNNSDSAVRIQTGSNADGYIIHSVALEFGEALEDPSGVKVSLWSNRKPGKYNRPKEEILAFTNPSSIEARLTEFTASPDTVLEPDTSYWVMIERTGDTAIRFAETGSDSEDSISEADWDIGSQRFHRPRNIDGKWGYDKVRSDNDQLKLRVIGYERSSE